MKQDTPATSPCRFVFRGKVREITEIDPTLTVLRWLREHEDAPGTKEGCAEGDCGACTVAVGSLDAGGALRYQAINACINFVPALHGKHLVTVEDLKGVDGGLHPAQQAMVEAGGSQCGFCTPGFVMSLFVMRHTGPAPDRRGISDALAGNLCRCTGYGPILQAAERMYGLDAPELDADGAITGMLRGLQDDATVSVGSGGRRWYSPATVAELARLAEAHPEATIVSGATDVGLWVTKQQRVLNPLIYTGRVAELREIRVADGWLEIGAGATYTDAAAVIARHYPDFGELVRRIGAVQVRNAGTVGGNIANGSPIGDTPPALIALGARLVLRKGAARREIPLEDFFIEYGRQDRAPGEFVAQVRVPLLAAGAQFRCYKLSKRFDQDISAACGAFHMILEDGVARDVRICFGGMAGVPQRAARAEQALEGKAWTEDAVQAAMAAMTGDYTPLTDMRASAAYRMTAARNLLYKFWLETSGGAADTRILDADALEA